MGRLQILYISLDHFPWVKPGPCAIKGGFVAVVGSVMTSKPASLTGFRKKGKITMVLGYITSRK